METIPAFDKTEARFAALPEFVSALEHGYHQSGDRSFFTTITTLDAVARYAEQCLRDINVCPHDLGWGEEGLVIDFSTMQDYALFALAFRGPRSR